MSIPTAPVHRTPTRLSTSQSFQMTTNNGIDSKLNRVSLKKPLSATGITCILNSNNAAKLLTHKSKKLRSFKSLQENGFNSSSSPKLTNGFQANGCSKPEPDSNPSLSTVFHAIAPATQQNKNFLHESVGQRIECDGALTPEETRRITNVLARTQIKMMSTAAVSSCSDEEGESSLHQSLNHTSSIDTEAHESEHEEQHTNKQTVKSRRNAKTRKASFSSTNGVNTIHNVHLKSSTPPTSKTSMRKDDQHKGQSSSNDDEFQEHQNDSLPNSRRLKYTSSKRKDRHHTTTTTTDDDTSRQRFHRYHPLENLEANVNNKNHADLRSESNYSSPLSPVPVSNNSNQPKKMNRFQIKSIRKSQQQNIFAQASAAKSSNDDDCSTTTQRSKILMKTSLIERKHTNTPTTDGENSVSNTDHIVNGAVSALKTVQNGSSINSGHKGVRFHVQQLKKNESAAEEEKSSSTIPQTVTTAPPSSTASAQGEDEEEEEAIAKSPDSRFIKYASEIGRGAFKTVYRGLDTETSVAVAWCELQDFAQFDKQERARFKEEAEMLKKLKHQNIVRFYDFWEETNPRTNKKVIILVTELMTSGSLKGYIRNFKGQNEGKRINVMKKWCRQILKGLAYLHGRNPPVIHRDLKCDNVFISSTTGCVKIGDLGLATFKTQTFAKTMRGTMEFMAPEMFDEKYDELVDIYSFGLCMLEMITGEYPYLECKGPTAVIKRVTAGLKPDCYYRVESEDVREVIDCCIRTKKEERLPVTELLQHSFFYDDIGLRVELVRDPSNDSSVVVKNDTIELKLKFTEKYKRKNLSAEQKNGSNIFEAILFPYNLTTDTPERIANELLEKSYILEDEKTFVIQSIKDRLRSYDYEQLDRQAGVFCRDGRPSINQTSQTQPVVQQTSIQGQQQAPGAPAINTPPTAPIVPVNPPPVVPTVQQTNVEQQGLVKPILTEATVAKSNAPSEPNTNVTTISDLPTSIAGSAGSLEVLEAALKKTFNKNNVNVNASANTATVPIDTSEISPPLPNQDENVTTKHENPLNNYEQTQSTIESIQSLPAEITNIGQMNNSNLLQSQSQPTTMLTNQQGQISQNPMIIPHQSQNYSYSALSNTSHMMNNTPTVINDTIKQVINPSLVNGSSTVDTTDNGHTNLSVSPPPPSNIINSNENTIGSVASDSTPQVSVSLQQLEALLKNTFKKQGKTAGTAHSSDGETANPITGTIHSVHTVSNEERPDAESSIGNETCSILNDDKRLQNNEQLINSSQQSTLLDQRSFDPLISTECNESISELHTFCQGSFKSIHSGEDQTRMSSQISGTSDEMNDLKSMLAHLGKSLLSKMDSIETKIEDQRQQTRTMNKILTETILPSMMDLTTIIQQTPSLSADEQIQERLRNIQTRIDRSQQQPNETKDLMDI